jgi:hypothetical protein
MRLLPDRVLSVADGVIQLILNREGQVVMTFPKEYFPCVEDITASNTIKDGSKWHLNIQMLLLPSKDLVGPLRPSSGEQGWSENES